ncbi:MAG: flavodoxin family protein [Synergistaceae bacterium]|jgi:multimeric flavodoxin WrbA|nr:flavodoxin family protein [Synergistaceae bacterium]
MKRVIAINGGPRKNWNTGTLLRRALDGAESAGAETETVHLYDLNFRGCVSCFSCKRVESYRNGRCAMRDDLSPVLERVMESDALIMGSPIYLWDVTGELRSFLERLVFMNLAYDLEHRSVTDKKISCGLIYTMNVPEDAMKGHGYTAMFESHVRLMKILGGGVEYMTSCDTYQFDDYSKYHAPMFDEPHKRTWREKQFPADCQNAYRMGARLVEI